MPSSVDTIQQRGHEQEGELDRSVMPVKNEVRAAEIMMPKTSRGAPSCAVPDGDGRRRHPTSEQELTQDSGGGSPAKKRFMSPDMSLG